MNCEEFENLICDSQNDDMTYVPYDGLLDMKVIDEELHLKIFNAALSRWTERQQLGDGYNKLDLQFYNGIIGYVIAQCNEHYQNEIGGKYWANPTVLQFLNQWKYDGVLYRVIDAPKSKIRMHKMISSWTKSVDAFDNFNHLHKNVKYTFLIANTNGYFGFDVNEYRKLHSNARAHTQHEQEVIFPMDGQYITDKFYGTLNEFKNYIKKHNK